VNATRDRVHLLELAPLVLGVLALAVATTFGWDARLLDLLVTPPVVVRIALTVAALIVAALLLGGAVARMEGRSPSAAGSAPASEGHLVGMLRGIRLAFLALAALSVALGWATGSALPFVVALIIAGIDVIETSFLLIVVRRGG
jgi:hypothetical protein